MSSDFRARPGVTNSQLNNGFPRPIQLCNYGSCDKTPGHDGQHRCRCGKLCDEPGRGCQWHLAGAADDV